MKKRVITISAVAAVLTVLASVIIKFNIVAPSNKEVSSMTPFGFGFPEIFTNMAEEEDSTKHTLLIYMIGSDLEAQSGAGTDDLKELEESGINLKNVNVIVYAGGSPRWHNDVATKEQNTILQLTEKGFKEVETTPLCSMGTSESLSEFLKYGYTNYPSDSYALIMWDHGNGPVIGYGKDMLFDDDSLTLSEMKDALASSPFSSSNKLSWVGFDACLMSSAELVCTWGDYAEYLVASQEIEPSFGWDYSVFKNFGESNASSFLSTLIDSYMSSCQSYYEKRGYENRDTTLACMELSKADTLEQAINELFAKASDDISFNYNTLVQKRVSTRALGRASTGSEYDLIDLKDMALQLESVYPEESKKLLETISSMVIKNGTNTQGCSGMSLYYPFYNKYYYEKSWGEVYSSLGMFENYADYLDQYQNIWLKDDKLDKYASSAVPTVYNSDGRSGSFYYSGETASYSLQLTPEQNENFAEAKFYILEKTSSNLFLPVASSQNIENRDGLLIAEFTGKAIYATNKYGKYILPRAKEYDTVGNLSRYSISTLSENMEKDLSEVLSFHVTIDNSTQELSTSALVPRNAQEDSTALAGGKLQEYNVNDWDIFSFGFFDYSYLTRYDNGTVKPLDQWVKQTYGALDDISRKDGFQLQYLPLSNDKYYLIFEITDTQGNKYCSEIMPIYGIDSVASLIKTDSPPPSIETNWSDGEKAKILEKDGVTIYIKKSTEYDKPVYRLEIENHRENSVTVYFRDLIFNDEFYTSLGVSENVHPMSVQESYFEVFPDTDAVYLGEISEITKLEGTIEITDNYDSSAILKNQHVTVHFSGDSTLGNLSEQYRPYDTSMPYKGALAEEQIILEDENVRVTLIGFCDNTISQGFICYENLSDNDLYAEVNACAINGKTITTNLGSSKVYPKTKVYEVIRLSDADLKENKIQQIEDLMILCTFTYSSDEYYELWDIPDKSIWLPVNLKEYGTEKDIDAVDGKIIYDEHDIIIYVDEYYAEYDEDIYWKLKVINNSDYNISLLNTNVGDNSLSISRNGIGSKQSSIVTLDYYKEEYSDAIEGKEVSFYLHILDIFASDVLFQGNEPITLTIEKPPEVIVPITEINWETDEEILIAQTEDVNVYIRQAKYIESGIPVYALKAENKSDKNLTVALRDILINGNLLMTYDVSIRVAPDKASMSAIEPLSEMKLGEIESIFSIGGTLSIKYDDDDSYILESQKTVVNMSSKVDLENTHTFYEPLTIYGPKGDALAEKQVLCEIEGVRVSLMYFGDSNLSYHSYICMENLTDKPRKINIDASCINGYTASNYRYFELPPKTKQYQGMDIRTSEDSIESLKLHISVWENKAAGIPLDSAWSTVTFTKHGKAEDYTGGKNVVFEKNGVKIIYDSYDPDPENYSSPIWNLTVINDRDEDLLITSNDSAIYLSGGTVGAHQRSRLTVRHVNGLEVDKIEFKLKFLDFYGTKALFETDERIALLAE